MTGPEAHAAFAFSSRHGDGISAYETPPRKQSNKSSNAISEQQTYFWPLQPSHDDSCLEANSCLTLGLDAFGGFATPKHPTRNSYVHKRGSSSGLPRSQSAGHFSQKPSVRSLASQNSQRYYTGTLIHPENIDYTNQVWNYTPTAGSIRTTIAEEDDVSEDISSACSGGCDIGEECNDGSCADEATACTDQHCQVDADHLAENRAAIVLAQLNAGASQAYQALVAPTHDFASTSAYTPLDLTAPYQTNHDTFMGSMGQSFEHMRSAHNDTLNVPCGDECPFLDLPDLDFCHLPLDNTWTDVFSNPNPHQASQECGFKADGPTAWIDHIIKQHRALLPTTVPGHADQNLGLPPFPSLDLSTPSLVLDSVDQTPGSDVITPANMSPSTMPIFDYEQPSKKRRLSSAPTHSLPGEFAPTTSMKAEQLPCCCYWHEVTSKPTCGLTFASSDELQQHVLNAHVRSATRTSTGFMCAWQDCPRCDKGFPQRSKLERHVQTHTGAKPFECDVCHEFFSAKQALEQHKLRHSETKPEQCHICGAFFRQKSALTMHIRTHTGERPLECSICGKTFTESSNLSKHKRTHEAEGRYKCSYGCGKSFHRHDQQLRHEKRHRPKGTDVAELPLT